MAKRIETYRDLRVYGAAFVAKLSDAECEAAETQVWLSFAAKCDHMTEKSALELSDVYDKVQAQLVLMIDRPEKWVIR